MLMFMWQITYGFIFLHHFYVAVFPLADRCENEIDAGSALSSQRLTRTLGDIHVA
jgi:hypothetical protein